MAKKKAAKAAKGSVARRQANDSKDKVARKGESPASNERAVELTAVMLGVTVDKKAAVREYLSARIGEKAVEDLERTLADVSMELEHVLGIQQHLFSATSERPIECTMDDSERKRLCSFFVELARGMYVRGHRFASGGAMADDEEQARRAEAIMQSHKIRRAYSATADKGMKQADRIAHVMEELGVSRATVYRAISGLL